MDEVLKERMLRTLKASAEDKWEGGECRTKALRDIYLTDPKGNCFNENFVGDDVLIDIQEKFYCYLDAIRNEFEDFIEIYVMPSYEDITVYFMIYKDKLVFRDSCKAWNFWWGTEEELAESMYDIYREILASYRPERTWPLWNLTEETIRAIAREEELTLIGKDFDEIARQTKKGIDAALDFVWEEAIENAIENTKAEWDFTITSIERTDFSEHGSGGTYVFNETWKGEVLCKAENDSLVLDFVLEHHVTEDGSNNEAKVTSPRSDTFTEDDWDDFVYRLENFICIDYKSNPWKAGG